MMNFKSGLFFCKKEKKYRLLLHREHYEQNFIFKKGCRKSHLLTKFKDLELNIDEIKKKGKNERKR